MTCCLSALANNLATDEQDKNRGQKNEFAFSIADGRAVDWRRLLRPANRSRRRDEHQRRLIHLPYQYDFPECLRSR